jgi:hypothetical protein
MAHIYVYKAQPISDKMHIQSKTLHIEETLPDSDTIDEGDALMGLDADKVVMALYEALPGGTFERVLAKMMERKLSHLHVPFAGLRPRDAAAQRPEVRALVAVVEMLVNADRSIELLYDDAGGVSPMLEDIRELARAAYVPFEVSE